MMLKKTGWSLLIAVSVCLPAYSLAQERTSTGYVSSVTARTLVLDGATYRFRPNQEEAEPVEVQCAVKDKKIDCEDLARISGVNRARAKVSFDRTGYVVRVQVLDALK